MRIAVYYDLPSGGAKRALYEMARRLVPRHMLDVYTHTTSDHEFCDLRPVVSGYNISEFHPLPLFGSPLGRLNQFQRWRDLGRLISLSKHLARQIDQAAYDVVFVNPSMWTQAPSLLPSLHTPTVYYMQEVLRQAYEPPLVRPYNSVGWRASLDRLDPLIYLYRRGLKAADWRNTMSATALLANSTFTASNIHRIYRKTAEVCYLGVDSARFRPLEGLERQNHVLSVGALRPDKGFDFLIAVLGALPQRQRPGLHIVANVGNPLEQQYLVELARQNEVDLHIEVGVDEETLIRRYNQARLVLYAPIREPFGFVPLEAMACGQLVIGVAEGGVTESVMDGVTGCLVRRDVIAFSQTLSSYLDDDALTHRMGQAARAHVVDNWSWEQTSTRLEEQLAKVAR